jgi:probable HAF family extracellular repeat protein
VVGFSTTENGSIRAFITGPDGIGMTNLGTLGGDDSQAYGINDAGRVVGLSWTDKELTTHAFITGPDGVGMTDLGTLGGDFSYASGINDAGQVAGHSTTDDGQLHAFITGPDGVGMTDLGTLGGNSSHAYGINDAGQVVGQSNTTDRGQDHAFITGPDGVGMTDLSSVVNLPTGFSYFNAIDINNHGQLVAVGTVVPEPEVYAMLLLGLGLIGFLARGRATA